MSSSCCAIGKGWIVYTEQMEDGIAVNDTLIGSGKDTDKVNEAHREVIDVTGAVVETEKIKEAVSVETFTDSGDETQRADVETQSKDDETQSADEETQNAGEEAQSLDKESEGGS